MTRSWLVFLVVFGLSGCGLADAGNQQKLTGNAINRPLRIISLDFCADQYVLKLASKSRILALSPDATREFSYMRAAASGIRQVPPRAEDVLLLKPDLVVRSYGGGEGIADLLDIAGVPVLQLGYAGSLAGVRSELVSTARRLGEEKRGMAIVQEMDRRIAMLPSQSGGETLLYATPGGVTTGPGSLVDELIRIAGFINFEKRPGWRDLPLERLVYVQPDRMALARFGRAEHAIDPWSAAGHPVMRQFERKSPIALDGAWTACGGWFVLDAAEAMARAGSSR